MENLQFTLQLFLFLEFDQQVFLNMMSATIRGNFCEYL